MPGAPLHLLQSDGAPARTKACWALYKEGSGQSVQYCTVLWTGRFAICLKVCAAPVAAVAAGLIQQANHSPVLLNDWAPSLLHTTQGVRNMWGCSSPEFGVLTPSLLEKQPVLN